MEYHRGFLLYHDLSFSTPFHAHSAHSVYAEYRLFVQLIAPSQNKTKSPHKETLCTAAGVELKSILNVSASVAPQIHNHLNFRYISLPKGKLKTQLKKVKNLRLTSVACKSAYHFKIRLISLPKGQTESATEISNQYKIN